MSAEKDLDLSLSSFELSGIWRPHTTLFPITVASVNFSVPVDRAVTCAFLRGGERANTIQGREEARKEEEATGSEKQEISLEGTKGRQRW